ncbi:hypothetical protein [Roseburia sp. 499]|uniref:hypothetical protein n=1 Tax=Roseburia sp. 499 TaxID=1261634 RepID=UPI00130130A8|nr:hypothetical protein [Roseburia sp. 499]WVK70933.1 hypothetical protein BIV20_05205 [Roseburia sp. 499]
MEWLLLPATLLIMLLCLRIANKIEGFYMTEEHFTEEMYQEFENLYQQQEEQEGKEKNE